MKTAVIAANQCYPRLAIEAREEGKKVNGMAIWEEKPAAGTLLHAAIT